MIISRTPLRMSFAGGGTDFKSYYCRRFGSVVSVTINKYVYVIVNPSFNEKIWVSYSKTEYVDTVDEIEHNLIREALKLLGIRNGISIAYISDLLPKHEGSGLGASSSLVVGILNALHAYKGDRVTPEQLAREAVRIELDILGHPMGKQDHYPAAFGGLNQITFHADERVSVSPVRARPEACQRLQKKLLLFYTNIVSSSRDVLPEQERRVDENIERLDALCAMSERLKEAIESEQFPIVGSILHEGWLQKKGLASKISNALIDSYYEKAIAAGAAGGKLLGSGGGGFFLFYCEEDAQPRVRAALAELREVSFGFEQHGSEIIYRGPEHGIHQ